MNSNQRVTFILSSKSGSCDAASILASAKRVSQENGAVATVQSRRRSHI